MKTKREHVSSEYASYFLNATDAVRLRETKEKQTFSMHA